MKLPCVASMLTAMILVACGPATGKQPSVTPGAVTSAVRLVATPTVIRPAAAQPGLQDMGPFVVRGTAPILASNRTGMTVVPLSQGDTIHLPAAVQWDGSSIVGPPAFLTLVATLGEQKVYLFVSTMGGGTAIPARFERMDDRTYRVVNGGSVVIDAHERVNDKAGDYWGADHHVAVDADGHLVVDPTPLSGDTVIVYATGEQLDVHGMTVVGQLPTPRRSPPNEWFETYCKQVQCGLSYRVGPLMAPLTGRITCQQGADFDLDAGVVRLQFRDSRIIDKSPLSPASPATSDCGPSRDVRVGEQISSAFKHYFVNAVSSTGEPLSVVVSEDGTLYIGHVVGTISCLPSPCRGT